MLVRLISKEPSNQDLKYLNIDNLKFDKPKIEQNRPKKQQDDQDRSASRLTKEFNMKCKVRLSISLVVLLIACSVSGAADRFALVIGNSKYSVGPLRNPSNDADAVEASLKALGFSVSKQKDLNRRAMDEAVQSFRRKLTKGSVGLFFFAGHGLQVKGENFLVPIGARMKSPDDVKYECVNVGRVLDNMKGAKSNLNVVILDSCRDNPFERSWSRSTRGNGLTAYERVPEGMIVAFSTAAGETAADGRGTNSPYTKHLVNEFNSLPKDGREILRVFRNASRAVKKEIGQTPYLDFDASMDDYFLKPTSGALAASSSSNKLNPANTVKPSSKSDTNVLPPSKLPAPWKITVQNNAKKASAILYVKTISGERHTVKAGKSLQVPLEFADFCHSFLFYTGETWERPVARDRDTYRFDIKEIGGKPIWKYSIEPFEKIVPNFK